MARTSLTSNDSHVTGYSCQRTLFSAKGREWFFFSSGTAQRHSSRDILRGLDCPTVVTHGCWGADAYIGSGAIGQSINCWWDDLKVHIMRDPTWATGEALSYRAGVPNLDGTITWEAERTISAGQFNIAKRYGQICIDSAGYPAAVFSRLDVGTSRYAARAVIATALNGSAWGAEVELDADPGGNVYPITVVPLFNRKLLAMWFNNVTGQIRSSFYNGAAWGAAVNVTAYNHIGVLSAVVLSDQVLMVTRAGGSIRAFWWSEAMGWSAGTVIATGTSVTLTKLSESAAIAFVRNGSSLFQMEYDGAWAAPVKIADLTNPKNDSFTSIYQAQFGVAQIAWSEDPTLGAGFEARSLSVIPSASRGIVTLPERNIGYTSTTLNGEVTDDRGEIVDHVGFVWDTTRRPNPGNTAPGLSAYANNWQSGLGNYRELPFTYAITGLVAGTRYHFRACRHLAASGEWAYGEEMEFAIRPQWPMGILYPDDSFPVATNFRTVFRLATHRNIRMPHAIVTTDIMTFAIWSGIQLYKLANLAVECHGKTHTNFTLLSEAQLRAEFTDVNNFYAARGWPPPQHCIYPDGGHNALVRTVTADYRKTGRATATGSYITNWAFANWFEIRADLRNINLGGLSTACKTAIDNRIAANECYTEHTHDIQETVQTGYGLWLPAFDEILAHMLHRANAMDFVTPDCLYRAFQGIRTYLPNDAIGENATLRGLTTTPTGGQVVDYVGFVWGVTRHNDPGNVAPVGTAYDSHWTSAAGAYAETNFSQAISGLVPGTEYWFRAAARVAAVWVYGEEMVFTPATPVGAPDPATNVTHSAATLNGLLGRDRGLAACETRFRYRRITPDWLHGWQYRKKITITGSTAGAQADYVMRVRVHRTTGADAGDIVYVGDKCDYLFRDIRFTTSDGFTELPYWVEPHSHAFTPGLDTSYCHVKVSSIPASPSQAHIYIYYGNHNVRRSTSDALNTFLLFEGNRGKGGMINEDANPWHGEWTQGWHETVLQSTKGDFWTRCYKDFPGTVKGFAIAWFWNPKSEFGTWNDPVWMEVRQNASNYARMERARTGVPRDETLRGVRGGAGIILETRARTWLINRFVLSEMRCADGILELYEDGALVLSNSWAINIDFTQIRIHTHRYTTQFAQIRLRKFVHPEPAITAWAAEEQENWTVTPWENLLIEADPYQKNVAALVPDSLYEFRTQARDDATTAEGEWSNPLYFGTLAATPGTPGPGPATKLIQARII